MAGKAHRRTAHRLQGNAVERGALVNGVTSRSARCSVPQQPCGSHGCSPVRRMAEHAGLGGSCCFERCSTGGGGEVMLGPAKQLGDRRSTAIKKEWAKAKDPAGKRLAILMLVPLFSIVIASESNSR